MFIVVLFINVHFIAAICKVNFRFINITNKRFLSYIYIRERCLKYSCAVWNVKGLKYKDQVEHGLYPLTFPLSCSVREFRSLDDQNGISGSSLWVSLNSEA